MGNKNNNLKHVKHVTLKNSDESFKALAKKVEETSPIGYTSGMGKDNYYSNEGRAYGNSYKEAVNEVAKRKGIS